MPSNKDPGNRLSREQTRQDEVASRHVCGDSPPELQTGLPINADTWPWTPVILRKVTPRDSTLIKRQVKNTVARGITGHVQTCQRQEVGHWQEPVRLQSDSVRNMILRYVKRSHKMFTQLMSKYVMQMKAMRRCHYSANKIGKHVKNNNT